MKSAALLLSACLMASVASVTHAAETNTPAANRAVITTQIEQMNRGDWKTGLSLYTPTSRNFGRPVGRAVMARIFADIYGTFPDCHVAILDITATGDSVIVRETTSGTHDGMGRIPVNGGMLVGVPPTHRHFAVDAIHWFKLKNGKIVDHFAVRDDLAMMQQLGLSAKPAPFDWAAFARTAAAGAASAK